MSSPYATTVPLVDTSQNPAVGTSFAPKFPQGHKGRILWWNDSPYGHYVSFNSGSALAVYYVPAYHGRLMTPAAAVAQIYYSVPGVATLTGSAAAPLNLLAIEYYPVDGLPGVADGIFPLTNRISNVGNTVPVSVSNQLGTTTEGLETTYLTGTGREALFPYTAIASANRGIDIQAMSAGTIFDVMTIDPTIVTVLQQFAVTLGSTSLDNGKLTTDNTGKHNTYFNLVTAGLGLLAILSIAGTIGSPWTAVAVTTDQIIQTITPTVIGEYLVGMRLDVNNGTSGQLIKAYVKFTDANAGSVQTIFFAGMVGGATAVSVAGGAASLANGVYALFPMTIVAAASTAIELHYQDPAGTPADRVSGFIVRVA